jgi:hypothetical protein
VAGAKYIATEIGVLRACTAGGRERTRLYNLCPPKWIAGNSGRRDLASDSIFFLLVVYDVFGSFASHFASFGISTPAITRDFYSKITKLPTLTKFHIHISSIFPIKYFIIVTLTHLINKFAAYYFSDLLFYTILSF